MNIIDITKINITKINITKMNITNTRFCNRFCSLFMIATRKLFLIIFLLMLEKQILLEIFEGRQVASALLYNSPVEITSLARENYQLVSYFAKSHLRNNKLTYDERQDLLQEGYLGFMHACRKYNATRGTKISTYSQFWINRYIIEYIKKLNKKKQNEFLINYKIEQSPHYDIISFINLKALTPREYDVIYKRYYQQKTLKSIAKIYGVNYNTIKSWIKTALFKIKITNDL